MAASKKGVSAHQIHRTIGVTYKTAWFMCHRLREAMREEPTGKLGSGGGIVEADETFGNERKPRSQGKKGRGYEHKTKVLTVVERGGKARSFHVNNVKASTLAPILRAHIDENARLMTDEAAQYTRVGREFRDHGVVSHGIGEYVRDDIHTNVVEGYFSIFKRGLMGSYHHISEAHLARYLAEFDFRYNNRAALGVDDSERADKLLQGIEGKRLTYN